MYFIGLRGWKYIHSNSVTDERHSFRSVDISERLQSVGHRYVKPDSGGNPSMNFKSDFPTETQTLKNLELLASGVCSFP